MTLHDFDILFGVPRRDLKALSTDAHLGGPHDTKEAAHRDVPRAPFGNGPCIVSLDCPPCTIKWQRA